MLGGNENLTADDTKEKEMLEKSQEDYHFHAWVYVDMVESSGFFIEATSG